MDDLFFLVLAGQLLLSRLAISVDWLAPSPP
jgi:hypothetical protein